MKEKIFFRNFGSLSGDSCVTDIYKKKITGKIKKNVMCCDCKNMNRYGWCYERRRCYDEDERYKKRQCMKFVLRKPKQVKRCKRNEKKR